MKLLPLSAFAFVLAAGAVAAQTYLVRTPMPGGDPTSVATAPEAPEEGGDPADLEAPSGYAVAWLTDPIDGSNAGAAAFEISSAEIGASFAWTATSDAGGAATGSGAVVSATQSVSGIDLSGLADGTLTLSVTLADAAGNIGAAATDTVTKSTAAPAALDCTDAAAVAAASPGTVCSDGSIFVSSSDTWSTAEPVPADHLLFVAAADLAEPQVFTTNSPFSYGGWQATGVGASYNDGRNNVLAMRFYGDDTLDAYPAARACDDLVAHGHSDWYLPAIGELLNLYDSREVIGGFSPEEYWTSAEAYDDDGVAIYVDFSNGASGPWDFDVERPVRCVRRAG